jgi:diguanylate cyclase (GGDEF)-like protein
MRKTCNWSAGCTTWPLSIPCSAYPIGPPLSSIWTSGSRPDAACTGITLIDIDQFAETNDMFGHAYGDLLLAAIAQRLRQHLGGSQIISRIAGDIFAVLGGCHLVSPEQLMPLFAEPFTAEGVARPMSVSMGFAQLDSATTSGPELLKNASIALKRAKSTGQKSKEHMHLLRGMHQALLDERFFPEFQPQINLVTGAVTGIEALLRWRSENGSLIPPGRFIPVAEQSGLIVSLGEWVLRAALSSFGIIHQAGFTDLRMAVNVSLGQCKHASLLDMLDETLAEHHLAPNSRELEITESVAIMGLPQVVSLLEEIKKRRIDVAIDDFGTGFSSLSSLDRLPVDRLKIDRSFISLLDSRRTGIRIAEMIVSFGHTLGITVLAEGVEQEQQAHMLKDMGCNEVQGYLYARPIPLEQRLVWLADRQGGQS